MTKRWELTSLDLFTLNMVIKGAWVFRQMPDDKILCKALKQLIKTYPHLTGHYQKKEKAILWDENYTEEPSLEIIFNHSYSIQDLIGKQEKVWSLIRKYDIKKFILGKTMPFSATLVKVKDGAVLIVQCAHATMDGFSFYRLIDQWASLTKGEVITPMTIDQSQLPQKNALNKTETLKQIKLSGWAKMKFPELLALLWNLFRLKFANETYIQEVPQEKLAHLKLESGAGTNAILSAIAAKEIMKHLAPKETFKIIFVADLRGHVSGVSGTLMGNLSQPFITHKEFSYKSTITELAKSIQEQNDTILRSNTLDKNLRLSICSTHYGLPYFIFKASEIFHPHPKSLYINNQLKFRACELDFGYGKPLYTFPNQLSDTIKFWQPISNGPIQIIYWGFMSKLLRGKHI